MKEAYWSRRTPTLSLKANFQNLDDVSISFKKENISFFFLRELSSQSMRGVSKKHMRQSVS
jgi:hypothetical protein